MLQRATHRAALAVLVGLVLAAPFAAVTTLPEYALYDFRISLISSLASSRDIRTSTAVILMDEASEDALGVPQGPEWRQFHASVIQTLTRAGARVIAFDAEFVAGTPWDEALAEACRVAGNVVAGEFKDGSTAPALAAGFRAIGSLAFGLARDRPRWVEVVAGERAPLSVVIAGLAGMDARPTGRVWIDFRSPLSAIPAFSYSEVLRAGDERMSDEARTPLSVFRDRVVLIGKDLPIEGDTFKYPNTMGAEYPGVYGQANAVETLLRDAPMRPPSPVLDLAFILAASVLAGFLGLLRHRAVRMPLLALLPVAAFVSSTALLAGPGIWVGLTGAFVAMIGALSTQWITRRMWLVSQLRRALGFRPDLIDAFRAASRKTGGTVQRHATVVCSDVRSFTKFVRDNPPDVVARVMSQYVGAMERIVTDHGGYVNKYVGDEIVAIFGFPLSEASSERRGVQAALEMQHRLRGLRQEWMDAGLPALDAIGVGVDSGTLTFAEVGGASKVQFDILGDPVNGASRLQSLTKDTGRPILVSADSFRGVDVASVAGRFETLGYLSLRGQGERQVLAPRTDETTP